MESWAEGKDETWCALVTALLERGCHLHDADIAARLFMHILGLIQKDLEPLGVKFV